MEVLVLGGGIRREKIEEMKIAGKISELPEGFYSGKKVKVEDNIRAI